MRRQWVTAAGLVALAGAGAGEARAQDWFMVPTEGDLGFVDAGSVVRRADGRISFRARMQAAPPLPGVAPAYDRYDVRVTGQCPAKGLPEDYDLLVGMEPVFFLSGRRVAASARLREDAQGEVGWVVNQLCNGVIGYRGFASVEAAMAEYAQHESSERLTGYQSGEVELVGTAVQGFEANYVSLCGSETGCVEGAATEACWLEGPVSVPAPAGAPEWVGGGPRRDAAEVAFKGRITRSRTGRGFGHLDAWGCLVEATGPARFEPIRVRPAARPAFGTEGRRPEAVAAHAAFVQAIAGAAAAGAGAAARVGLAADGRQWTFDSAHRSDDERGPGACRSYFKLGGKFLENAAPEVSWTDVSGVERREAAVTVLTAGYDEQLVFHLGTPPAAAALKGIGWRVEGARAAGIEQAGRRVTVRLAGGGEEVLNYPDAARAVEAAGIAGQLFGRELFDVRVELNQLTARPLRRVTFVFGDGAQAREGERLMKALAKACEPAR